MIVGPGKLSLQEEEWYEWFFSVKLHQIHNKLRHLCNTVWDRGSLKSRPGGKQAKIAVWSVSKENQGHKKTVFFFSILMVIYNVNK